MLPCVVLLLAARGSTACRRVSTYKGHDILTVGPVQSRPPPRRVSVPHHRPSRTVLSSHEGIVGHRARAERIIGSSHLQSHQAPPHHSLQRLVSAESPHHFLVVPSAALWPSSHHFPFVCKPPKLIAVAVRNCLHPPPPPPSSSIVPPFFAPVRVLHRSPSPSVQPELPPPWPGLPCVISAAPSPPEHAHHAPLTA
jgi:hypothetical protein